MPDGELDARGTGRTTLMLLHALVAYEEGQDVALVGQVFTLREYWAVLAAAAGVTAGVHPAGPQDHATARFIDHAHHARDRVRSLALDHAIFVDHWAAHQIVEAHLMGATVMESPY